MVNRKACASGHLRRPGQRDNDFSMKARGQPLAGSKLLIRRFNRVQTLCAAGVLVAAFALAGCKTDGVFPGNMRANAPIPPALLATMQDKGMSKEAPILIRLFKEEAELEVWKQDASGRYALLKTYPICRWSGELGPKIKEGDRQAPEGFYDITPGQMNPNSSYFLAFNLGYPNAFDRAWDRTGMHLMVHGDCSSRGCYAMSDEQISEIFSLARESFFAGQKSFQVQAYPFRMTPANMAKHRNSPHYAFWKMIKQGSDHFEVTRMEPKIDVCERRYVFNAHSSNATPVNFNPKGKCPAFQVPQDVLAAVHDKQRRDELQTAQLIAQNVPTAPTVTNRDGGMHPVFVAALKPTEVVDEKGKIRLVVENPPPGKLASVAYSPAVDDQISQTGTVASQSVAFAGVPLPRQAPQAKEGVAPEPSFAEKLNSLFRTAVAPAQPAPPATPAAPAAAPQPEPKRTGSLFSRAQAAPKPKPAETNAAEAPGKEPLTSRVSRAIGLRGSGKKTPDQTEAAAAPGAIRRIDPAVRTAKAEEEPQPPAAAPTRATGSLISGSQPIPQSSNFDSRWTAFR